MTRRRQVILAELLAVSAGCVAMCVRSYHWQDFASGPGAILVSDWGGLHLARITHADLRVDWAAGSTPAHTGSPFKSEGWYFLGFSCGIWFNSYGMKHAWLGLPWWLLAMVPLFFAWRLRRKWRTEAGSGFEPVMPKSHEAA